MITVPFGIWNTNLGNKLFRHAYASFLSKNNDLYWDCDIEQSFNLARSKFLRLGRKLSIVHRIDENNAGEFMDRKLNGGAMILSYCQQPSVVNHRAFGEHLADLFSFKKVDTDPETVFIHIRNSCPAAPVPKSCVLPFEYYDRRLSLMDFKNGVIASHDENDDITRALVKKYGFKTLKYNNASETLVIGASHRKMVLSLGSYSFWIGALASPEAEVEIITMNDATQEYGTASWHPNYSLDVVRANMKPCKT
jgi:hypothetical protein